MTVMMQKLVAAGLKPSDQTKHDVQRNEAGIQKPKWMLKAEKKFGK